MDKKLLQKQSVYTPNISIHSVRSLVCCQTASEVDPVQFNSGLNHTFKITVNSFGTNKHGLKSSVMWLIEININTKKNDSQDPSGINNVQPPKYPLLPPCGPYNTFTDCFNSLNPRRQERDFFSSVKLTSAQSREFLLLFVFFYLKIRVSLNRSRAANANLTGLLLAAGR